MPFFVKTTGGSGAAVTVKRPALKARHKDDLFSRPKKVGH